MKKTISVLLAILMVLSLLPATAMAAEPEDEARQEMLQQEDVIPREETDLQPNEMDDEEQPDPAPAAAETENAPAPLNASGDDMDVALRKAGYEIPTVYDFDISLPDGLENGVDYTCDYDSNTGHVSIRLLMDNMEHWKQALEMWYDSYGNVSDFGPIVGFENSVNAYRLISYFTREDNNVVEQLANNDLSSFSWYGNGEYLHPGSSRTNVFNTSMDKNGTMRLQRAATTDWVRCIVLWGDEDGEVLAKYMYTVSIEAPDEFDLEWEYSPLSDLERQLRDAGFTAPKMDNWTSGAFSLGVPQGLKEGNKAGADYTYSYNEKTGELKVSVKKGTAADWKTAYLDTIFTEDAYDYDIVAMGIYFRSVENAATGINCSDIYNRQDLMALLRGDYESVGDSFDADGDYLIGGSFGIASVMDNGDGTVTIGSDNGESQFYRVAIWKDADGNVIGRYLIKVTFTYTAFTHTVPAVTRDKLNAADAARFELELEKSDSFMTTILKNGKVTLVPKASAALTDEGDNIGAFRVKAPAGYTLQSCYISYSEGHDELVSEFDNDGGYWVPLRMEDANTDGHTQLILRWKNNNAKAADLIEVLDVYVDSGWGKLSNSDGQPNATDVQAIYEYLTQNKTPACGDNAACDVNMDGNVDVYDLQYLYECVAGI